MSYNRWMPQEYQSGGELYHYGVLGMKWGIRRYQDKYGHLTDAGRKRARKLDEKGDAAYARGNIKKAGKLYAKAGFVRGDDVAKTQETARWFAARSRFDELGERTEAEKLLDKRSGYYRDPRLTEKQRDEIFNEAMNYKERADILKDQADRWEKKSKALVAKYGDLIPENYDKVKIKGEEELAKKQMIYLSSSPYTRKRLEKRLKEALEYENQPQNKADKDRMKDKYDDEGRPLLSDWPKLTESDRIKDDLKRLKRGYAN